MTDDNDDNAAWERVVPQARELFMEWVAEIYLNNGDEDEFDISFNTYYVACQAFMKWVKLIKADKIEKSAEISLDGKEWN